MLGTDSELSGLWAEHRGVVCDRSSDILRDGAWWRSDPRMAFEMPALIDHGAQY
jgi:hypothetical protein